jgi:hypothetical protein
VDAVWAWGNLCVVTYLISSDFKIKCFRKCEMWDKGAYIISSIFRHCTLTEGWDGEMTDAFRGPQLLSENIVSGAGIKPITLTNILLGLWAKQIPRLLVSIMHLSTYCAAS